RRGGGMATNWSFAMKKPCETCPFRSDIPLDGAPAWVNDILKGAGKGTLQHSCHRSDPKADGYKGAKKTQHCIGYLGFLKNIRGAPSAEVFMAALRGELDWNAVPTEGIWKSMDEMMLAYLCKYRDEGLLSPDLVAKLESRLEREKEKKCERPKQGSDDGG